MSTLNPYFYAYNPELLAFENAWIKFVKHQEINTSVIRPEVCESWQRCYALGMDPLSNNKIPLISKENINKRLEKNKLLMSVVTPYMDSIYETIKGSGFRVDFSDAEGYTLRSFCDEDTLEICDKTNSFPGANRLESVAGTNSIGIALLTGKPIQVAGAEHYVQIFHRWAGSSAPIKQEDGKVLGVLSVIGRYELVHFHTLALVSSAAKAIENELYIHKVNEQIEASNSQLRTTLETVTDGVVYLAKDKIMQVNKQMRNLIGKEEADIVGENVYDVIKTIPALNEMFNTEHNVYHEGEIVLKGNDRSYKCLFAYRGIVGNNGQETGKVLIFTTVEEVEQLAKKIKYKARYTFDAIIRQSAAMKNAVEMARKASRHDSRVMIEGESGTGKEMFAQAIHNHSVRKNGPFIAIDCGTLTKELLESELFGYESGAFTGAKKDGKKGLLELADKGTLFFDEIGNMPMEMQTKLLRVLQEGYVKRVGGITPIGTDVRVIAATNSNLKGSMKEGSFREDLYYRLNVFNIQIPPLRERKEDIPLLVDHFLAKSNLNKGNYKIEKRAITALQEYDWPGNVRQLENAIERAMIMSGGRNIRVEDLPLEISRIQDRATWPAGTGSTLEEKMEEYIEFVLKKNNHNVTKTAKELGISRSKVYSAIEKIEEKIQEINHDL